MGMRNNKIYEWTEHTGEEEEEEEDFIFLFCKPFRWNRTQFKLYIVKLLLFTKGSFYILLLFLQIMRSVLLHLEPKLKDMKYKIH